MTAAAQVTTNKEDKSTLKQDKPIPENKSKLMKAKDRKLPVTNNQPTPDLPSGLGTWSRDVERMMDEAFESWSNFSKMIPFGGAPTNEKADLANLTNWKEQTDRYFEDINRRWEELGKLSPYDMYRVPNGFLYKLKVDIEEDHESYSITAELPGLRESDIHISIDEDKLTISGNKCVDRERQGCVRERRFGSFLRSFTLPAALDPDQAEARFKSGVLTVTLPKTATHAAIGREIPIKH